MNISIRDLRVFVTIADAQSLVTAAELLHVTGGAISATLKNVEGELGFALFERTTRSVRLTEQGRHLLDASRQMLADHERFTRLAASVRDHKVGMVRISSTPVLSTMLPRFIVGFRQAWPDIEIVHVAAPHDQFIDLLQRREIDLGLGPERLPERDVLASPLFSSRLHVVCSTRHRFASMASVPWSDLVGETVYLVDRQNGAALTRYAEQQVNFSKATIVGHFTTAFAFASANEGVVVSAEYARPQLLPYTLAMVPLDRPRVDRRFMVFTQRGTPLTPCAQQFFDHMRSSMTAEPFER